MRNNVPLIHELEEFNSKTLIIELDLCHFFPRSPNVPKDMDRSVVFDPKYYFVTSGEAIEKMKFMLIDIDYKLSQLLNIILKSIMGSIKGKKPEALAHFKSGQKLPKSLIPYKTYYDFIGECKKEAKILLTLLRKFRGTNCFLETEWDSHRLLCISKNPRMKDEVDEE